MWPLYFSRLGFGLLWICPSFVLVVTILWFMFKSTAVSGRWLSLGIIHLSVSLTPLSPPFLYISLSLEGRGSIKTSHFELRAPKSLTFYTGTGIYVNYHLTKKKLFSYESWVMQWPMQIAASLITILLLWFFNVIITAIYLLSGSWQFYQCQACLLGKSPSVQLKSGCSLPQHL